MQISRIKKAGTVDRMRFVAETPEDRKCLQKIAKNLKSNCQAGPGGHGDDYSWVEVPRKGLAQLQGLLLQLGQWSLEDWCAP